MKTHLQLLDSERTRALSAQLAQIRVLTIILRVAVGLSALALVGATADGELGNYGTDWHALWIGCAVVVVALWLMRLVWRGIIRQRLWAVLGRDTRGDQRPQTLNEVVANGSQSTIMRPHSVVVAGASSYETSQVLTLKIDRTPVITAEVQSTFTIAKRALAWSSGGGLQLGLTLRLFTFTTPQYMPHIFITSKRQSVYGLNTRNMGLIDERLPRNLKFPGLEGDFSRYFEIFSPDKAAIDILRVMSPDVMIELRDHGVDFDIEIIDDRFYLYLEPSTSSPAQLETVLTAVGKVVAAFAGELGRSRFYDEPTGVYIPAKVRGFYGTIILARFSLVAGGYLLYTIVAVLAGEAIASLYR